MIHVEKTDIFELFNAIWYVAMNLRIAVIVFSDNDNVILFILI